MEREELDLLLDGARRWFAEHAPLSERVARFRQGHLAPTGSWAALAGLGWLALPLPEEAGGFGAPASACFELLRLAGRDARPEALDLHLLLAPLLVRLAPELAASLSAGTLRLAMADLQPEAERPRRDAEQLSGRTGALLGAEHATHALLPLASGGLALLELAAAGVSREPARWVDGRATARLQLDRTTVRHWPGLAEQAVDRAAAALVADATGVFEAAFELTLDYLKQRMQFGKPLSANQALQHRMAEIFCDLQQALALTERLAQEIDAEAAGPWPTLPVAKSFVGRRVLRGVGALIQVTGGIAVTEEYRLTHWYRRLHVNARCFGAAEAQLNRIEVRRQLLAA